MSDDFAPGPYLALGFTPGEAQVWHRWRISPHTAVAWRDAGVPDGLQAAQWTVAGVSPGTVRQWQTHGIDPGEAVHWHEFGFPLAEVIRYKQRGMTAAQAWGQRHTTQVHTAQGMATGTAGAVPEIMRRFRDAGVRPEILNTYFTAQWLDEEGLAWAREDINAFAARLWAVFNLTAAEAGRLTRQGLTPQQLVRDWWRAGIPYDEVAAWLGAGLTAEEAAAQRAQGITAEQAATLRALRDGEDLDDEP